MSPKTGRPLSDNPKTESLHIRVTPEEKKQIRDFQGKTGYSILELIKAGIEAIK